MATTFDGYPLAQKGRAGEALTASFTSSFVGALIAVILITFLAPIIASFALQFGPAEFFSVQLLTFCSFVGMGKESPFKTIASMMIGFALAAVGLDTVTGQLRMTFGFNELLNGFDFLVAVIGLFGIGEIMLTMEEGLSFKGASAKINPLVVLHTWKILPRYWATSLRGAAIGCWLGITPGGATPASFMSYGLAKRFSKNGDKFGTGEIEGVVAPETAAHAAGTSALSADADAGHSGFADRGGAARRPVDLGPSAGTAALRGAEGLRLGHHRRHVCRQRRRPRRRTDDGAVVGRHPAHSHSASSRR